MSINIGTYALVSALAVGGAVAQHQYSQPAGPQDPNSTDTSYSATPAPMTPGSTTETATGPIDCNTLATHHQAMNKELDQLDDQADKLLTQMREAKSDKAKLDATMGVVEALVTQRKQMRERMGTMEHETIQFLMTNKSTDFSQCAAMMTKMSDDDNATEESTVQDSNTQQGGPNDMELGNDR